MKIKIFSLAAPLLLVAFAIVFLGYSIGHSDGYNYVWTMLYIDAFQSGSFFPRHLPSAWSGLGGYDFFFYGPLPYWVTAAFVSPLCQGCAVETKIVVSVALFAVLSGLTCYWFLRRFFTHYPAALGAIGYTVLPYHLILDWFMRQALGEFAAYAFLPLAALGIDAIRCDERGKFWLPIGVAGVLLCHLPTALLAAHVLGFSVLIFTVDKVRRNEPVRKFLSELLFLGAIGGALASFYWLPAIVLVEYVSKHLLYTEHFISSRWLLQFSMTQTSPLFGKTVLWSALTVLPLIVIGAFYAKREVRYWIVPALLLILFLNIELSAFIWDNWLINRVQFPWRLLVFVDLVAALAIASLASKLTRLPVPALIACVTLPLLPAVFLLKIALWWMITPYDRSAPMIAAKEYLTEDFYDAIESRANDPNDPKLAKRRTFIYAQAGEIFQEASDLNNGQFTVEYGHREALITLQQEGVSQIVVPLQFWKFWEARLPDGTPLELSPKQGLGVIAIAAPDGGFGEKEVRLELPYHWTEKLGFLLSISALLLWLIAMQVLRMRDRRAVSSTGRS